MKTLIVFIALLVFVTRAHCQGFVVDQQSTNLVEGAAFLQSGQPMGQSFMPAYSVLNYVLLNLYDSDFFHSSGSFVLVNIRSNSITGPILGSSSMVFIPDGFIDTTNFTFQSQVSLVPGMTYYIQPMIQSGDTVGSYVTDGSYTGGTLLENGIPVSGRNLWFQEGIIGTPEPSLLTLAALGGLLLRWRVQRRR